MILAKTEKNGVRLNMSGNILDLMEEFTRVAQQMCEAAGEKNARKAFEAGVFAYSHSEDEIEKQLDKLVEEVIDVAMEAEGEESKNVADPFQEFLQRFAAAVKEAFDGECKKNEETCRH